MEIELQRFEDAVVSRLGPFLGESMARAALVGHCRSLGIDVETLAEPQIDRLLVRLRQGMTLFVGADKAMTLADLLRDDLQSGAQP